VISAADIGAAAADELTITEIEGNDVEAVTIISNGEVIVNDIDGDVLESVDLSGVAAGGAAVTISDHAASLVVLGSDGQDTITMTDNTNTSEVEVDLGAGNDTYVSVDATDTITTGSGSDTVTLQGDANDDANVITDFTAGAGGDVIDFVTSIVNGADDVAYTAYQEFSTMAAWASDTAGNADDEFDGGLVVIGANVTAGTAAALVTAAGTALVIADTAATGAGTADDALYIAIDDGVDTYIFAFEAGDTDGTIDADDTITLLATLVGVSDATALSSANFADFI
jgi:hypothetical protein